MGQGNARVPVYPDRHMQSQPPVLSTQYPEFLQGELAHSFTFTPQFGPLNIGGQAHMYPSTMSTQVPQFLQGALTHSLMLTSQLVPVNPAAQVQQQWLMPSMQDPPFWHGELLHSWTLISQLVPIKPGILKCLIPLITCTIKSQYKTFYIDTLLLTPGLLFFLRVYVHYDEGSLQSSAAKIQPCQQLVPHCQVLIRLVQWHMDGHIPVTSPEGELWSSKFSIFKDWSIFLFKFGWAQIKCS